MTVITKSPEQTELLGKKLAELLRPGDVIAYYGDLGAGKTAFTRGLAAGLGIREAVTSPTYTIVNEYLSGRMPLFHFDMYRLSSSDELFDIGVERECCRRAHGRDFHHDRKGPRAARLAQNYDRRGRTL